MDDHVDVVDVNAARCDVGGNENGELSTGEVGQSPLARALPEIAVDGPGAHTLTATVTDLFVSVTPRPDSRLSGTAVQQVVMDPPRRTGDEDAIVLAPTHYWPIVRAILQTLRPADIRILDLWIVEDLTDE